jgi:hypothetical protein
VNAIIRTRDKIVRAMSPTGKINQCQLKSVHTANSQTVPLTVLVTFNPYYAIELSLRLSVREVATLSIVAVMVSKVALPRLYSPVSHHLSV